MAQLVATRASRSSLSSLPTSSALFRSVTAASTCRLSSSRARAAAGRGLSKRLTGSKATLISALKNLKHDEGGTYMVPAVRNAKSVLSSGHAGVPKVLLMLTDGRPSDRPASEFQSAKAAGIKVMMVLVGKNIRRSTGCQYPASSVAHRRTLLPCFLDNRGKFVQFYCMYRLVLRHLFTMLANATQKITLTHVCKRNSSMQCMGASSRSIRTVSTPPPLLGTSAAHKCHTDKKGGKG